MSGPHARSIHSQCTTSTGAQINLYRFAAATIQLNVLPRIGALCAAAVRPIWSSKQQSNNDARTPQRLTFNDDVEVDT